MAGEDGLRIMMVLCSLAICACSDGQTNPTPALEADSGEVEDTGADDRDTGMDSGVPDVSEGDVPESEGPLEGPEDAPARERLPVVPLATFSADDFHVDPVLGITVGAHHVVAMLAQDATVAEVNDAIDQTGATILGTLREGGVLVLGFGEGAVVGELRDRLRAHTAFEAVVLDTLLGETALPPHGEGALNFQQANDSTTWHFQAISAPQAWDLKHWLDDIGTTPVSVAVIDTPSFGPHPDVPFTNSPQASVGNSDHGLEVSGVIGATWNEQWSVGVSPYVTLSGFTAPLIGNLEQRIAWSGLLDALRRAHAETQPRVVNVSLGYNWSNICNAGQTCDPTGRFEGSTCDHEEVQALIGEAGAIMAAVVDQINDERPVLFVTSAGNDSSDELPEVCTLENGDQGVCAQVSDCMDEGGTPEPLRGCSGDETVQCCSVSSCVLKLGLGRLPAVWNSPLARAAISAPEVRDDIIVVESMSRTFVRTRFERARSSNIDAGGVFAPGVRVTVPTVEEMRPELGVSSGTSFAAPQVAGAAAWLLAIEEELSNADLRRLLTESPHARPFETDESTTGTSLDLLLATYGLDELRNERRLRVLMADQNDDSLDGFQRVFYDDEGEPSGSRQSTPAPDGRIDLRDFRRMRDIGLLQVSYIDELTDEFHTQLDGVTLTRGDLDINLNGVSMDGSTNDGYETYAVGTLITNMTLFDIGYFLGPGRDTIEEIEPIEALSMLYALDGPDSIQPFAPEDLEALSASGDVTVRIAALLSELDADKVRINIDYEGPLNPEIALAEPSAFSGIDLSADAVLTVPDATRVVLSWEAISGEGDDEVVIFQGEEDLGTVETGHDRVLTLAVPECVQEGRGACEPEIGFVLSTDVDALIGFAGEAPFANQAPCTDTDEPPDLGTTLRSDFLPVVVEGQPRFAVAYPYQREIRLFNPTTCAQSGTFALPPEGPGPVAMDTTEDGLLIVAQWDPLDACAPGAVSILDLDEAEVLGSLPLDRGASDVAILDGPEGAQAVVTTPGDDGCLAARLNVVGVEGLLQSLPEALTLVPTPGSNTTRAHRIARTRDRQWAAWITDHADTVLNSPGGGGRVGVMRGSDLSVRVFDPRDFGLPSPTDWDGPKDLAVITEGEGVRVYFVYEFARKTNRPDYDRDCQQRPATCSALRWIRWDGAQVWSVSGERTLPYTSVRRIAITADRRSAFIAHASGAHLVRWDLGTGLLDNFLWDDSVDLQGAARPTALWVP